MNSITLTDIIKAQKNFDGNVVKQTPLEHNHSLSKKFGANVYLKREDLQLVRSYKIRGSYNLISSLSQEEKDLGVVAASAGNHAQGVALCCKIFKIQGTIFMPQTTPSQKIRKTRAFGGAYVKIELVGDSFDETYQQAMKYCEENGNSFIHPFDDHKVIVGQGTVGLEIINDFKSGEVDYLLVPIGGGGLSAGVGSIFKELSPQTKIFGVEPENACGMKESICASKVVTLNCANTIAEGTAVKTVGNNTYEICKNVLDDMLTVQDGHLATVMLNLLDDQGIILEGAGALTIAALDSVKDQIQGKNVVCILSGGNFDFSKLPEIQDISLKYEGLKRYFIISFPQRPGALREFLDILGEGVDVVYFEYIKKSAKERGPALVGLEANEKYLFENIISKMNENNIHFEDITYNQMYYDFLT
ncbi:MAG: threonine ammonia-lyase IlvA [Candidatus Absconditabacteria bacterium]